MRRILFDQSESQLSNELSKINTKQSNPTSYTALPESTVRNIDQDTLQVHRELRVVTDGDKAQLNVSYNYSLESKSMD